MRRFLFPLIGLVVGALGVIGYLASRGRIDASDADAKLKEWAERTVAPVTSVTCPEARMKKGNAFDCKVVFASGRDASITVEMQDDDGNVQYHWTKPIAGGEKIAAVIADRIKSKTSHTATVDCGKGVIDVPADGLVCNVSLDDKTTAHARVKYDASIKDYNLSIEQ